MSKEKQYIEAVGRRKTAVARVRLTPGDGSFTVNGRELTEYFPTSELKKVATESLALAGKSFSVSAKVLGGGISAQSEAVRHGIARALTKWEAEMRPTLKKEGFLKRDPRMKERKKFGLKKARRAPQWSKR